MRAVLRCDATADIGFGHLSRCIALAEAFRLFDVPSVFAGLFDPAAGDQIAASGFDRIDLGNPVSTQGVVDDPLWERLGREAPASFAVVDSYRADEVYLSTIKALGTPTVVVDDFCALEHYPCDVLLNFTWEAASLGYPKGPLHLLGPYYFPARRQLIEFRSQSIRRERCGAVRNLLIAIGGSDPRRLAARLVSILRQNHPETCVHLIAANDADMALSVTDFAPGSKVLPRQPDLSKPLLWADACLTGGGLIKYESAFMGVPAAAISQNEGQAGETRALTRAGLVTDLGLADDRSDAELAIGLNKFLRHEGLRNGLAGRIREIFPPDPAANAAGAILNAMRR
jgi:spore coat polysaccharide biosynthesis predicted glycosyltransferase SpsG